MRFHAYVGPLVLSMMIFLLPNRTIAMEIVAGPMLGHVTESTATIWVQQARARNRDLSADAVQNNRSIPGRIINHDFA